MLELEFTADKNDSLPFIHSSFGLCESKTMLNHKCNYISIITLFIIQLDYFGTMTSLK